MFSGLCQEGTLDKSLRISVRKANKDNYKMSQCFHGEGILLPKIWQNFFEKKKEETGKDSDIGNDEWI